MSRELHLADETFERLTAIAAEKGLTPEEWITTKVREERRRLNDERPLSEVLEGHIGVLDSGARGMPYTRDAFSRIIAEKFGVQGIEKQ